MAINEVKRLAPLVYKYSTDELLKIYTPPLHIAAIMDNKDAIEALQQCGADLEQKNICGQTPLDVAIICQSNNAIQVLQNSVSVTENNEQENHILLESKAQEVQSQLHDILFGCTYNNSHVECKVNKTKGTFNLVVKPDKGFVAQCFGTDHDQLYRLITNKIPHPLEKKGNITKKNLNFDDLNKLVGNIEENAKGQNTKSNGCCWWW